MKIVYTSVTDFQRVLTSKNIRASDSSFKLNAFRDIDSRRGHSLRAEITLSHVAARSTLHSHPVFVVKHYCIRSLHERPIKRLWRSDKKPCAVERANRVSERARAEQCRLNSLNGAACDSFSNLLTRVYRPGSWSARGRSRDDFVRNTRRYIRADRYTMDLQFYRRASRTRAAANPTGFDWENEWYIRKWKLRLINLW